MIDAGHDKFRRLMEPLFDKMYASAYRLTGSRDDAEDLVQETFLKAYRSIDRFEEGTNPGAWVYMIMRNTFLNNIRSKKGREVLLFDEEMAERLADTSESYVSDEKMDEELQAVLNSLPPDMKEALVAREVNGLSYQEIADSMGLPIGTVKSRINRAREALKGRWLRLKGGSTP
ncbi:MAG: sigma-70 family RNA polymerase sigma factor [Nitrospinae bacterium]|nr:sigma-70 family RNA polymerase sigma factor [Nitrospinota bacterium]